MGIIGNNNIVKSDNEQLLNAPYGMQGAMVITDVAMHSGEWYCIMAIEDGTQLTTSDCLVNWAENGTTFSTNLMLITGVPYYGNFTQVRIQSGKIIAYNK
jgi:hypothetical protein|tara:strand:+ start:922 stop:1221 length:300 start_codon:yes stop_codon:yes gene_type:complete